VTRASSSSSITRIAVTNTNTPSFSERGDDLTSDTSDSARVKKNAFGSSSDEDDEAGNGTGNDVDAPLPPYRAVPLVNMIVTTSRALLINTAVGVCLGLLYTFTVDKDRTSFWTLMAAGMLFTNVIFRCHLLLRYFEFAQVDQQARHAKQQHLIREKMLRKFAKMQILTQRLKQKAGQKLTTKTPEKKQRKQRRPKKSHHAPPHVVYVWNDKFGPNPGCSSSTNSITKSLASYPLRHSRGDEKKEEEKSAEEEEREGCSKKSEGEGSEVCSQKTVPHLQSALRSLASIDELLTSDTENGTQLPRAHNLRTG
jgi:hypothetical protein